MATSATVPINFNYAKFSGIHSVPAAIVFASLYVFLLAWFLRQSFARPTTVHYVLTFFCSIRIAAFAIRAVLAGSEGAGENLGLLIAESVLFGVGYFGLLYSAYTLVLDLEALSGHPQSKNIFMMAIKNRRLFRLTMTVAVVLGSVSSSISNGGSSHTVAALHKATIIIFLVLTVIQAFQTVVLIRMEYSDDRMQFTDDKRAIGKRHGSIILLLVSILLLVREGFSAATMADAKRQENEHFWYPLMAVPEILAVFLYSTPGLVPKRRKSSEGSS